MDDQSIARPPAALAALRAQTRAMGFQMSCEDQTGALLRTLAASRPGARILELGTGAGVSTAWLLDGMDARATLLTVDDNAELVAVARAHLGADPRVTFTVGDGAALLRELAGQRFDLVFADTWPGKYWARDEALALLPPGGWYVIDDLLPQATWPDGHGARVAELLEQLDARPDLVLVRMRWASGLILAVKR
jgi:predicted O-methyltransferase YrrM